MRTGNQPVRYEVSNESAVGKLAVSVTASQTTLPLQDATNFPNEAGLVYVDNELIEFSGKSGNTLIGCTRSAPLNNFAAGANRSYTGGAASTHEYNTGVILVSNTISPIISHWGSAFITDGQFDSDRGYLFNYVSTGLQVTTTVQTAFLLRLAPSVSNAIVGDLGDRELLNRAQLLLQAIEVTVDPATSGQVVINGVINPQNYPTDPSLISWGGLSSLSAGGQPSFSQIAPGGSVSWAGGASQTTSTGTTTAVLSATVGIYYTNNSGGGVNYIYTTTSDMTNYGIVVGATISSSDNRFQTGTTITQIYNYSPYSMVYLSKNTNLSVGQGTNVVFQYGGNTPAGQNYAFFTKTSWESLIASGLQIGQVVSDSNWPANTTVNSISAIQTFGATQFYRVNFNQNSVAQISAGSTVTFVFGQPPYALPGETVFSLVASQGNTTMLDLSGLKELTNTTLGGRGTFPNGPDVLAINIYRTGGSGALPASIVIRWGEAQA
jgi:hypothetical protein